VSNTNFEMMEATGTIVGGVEAMKGLGIGGKGKLMD
jgi:hypothetical protein